MHSLCFVSSKTESYLFYLQRAIKFYFPALANKEKYPPVIPRLRSCAQKKVRKGKLVNLQDPLVIVQTFILTKNTKS